MKIRCRVTKTSTYKDAYYAEGIGRGFGHLGFRGLHAWNDLSQAHNYVVSTLQSSGVENPKQGKDFRLIKAKVRSSDLAAKAPGENVRITDNGIVRIGQGNSGRFLKNIKKIYGKLGEDTSNFIDSGKFNLSSTLRGKRRPQHYVVDNNDKYLGKQVVTYKPNIVDVQLIKNHTPIQGNLMNRIGIFHDKVKESFKKFPILKTGEQKSLFR